MDKPQWDTSKGRRWVVVAFWGVETTVEFFGDLNEAQAAYKAAAANGAGADALVAEVQQMFKHGDEPSERTQRGKRKARR